MKVTDLISKEELNNYMKIFSEGFNIITVLTEPDGTPITDYINYTDLCGKYHRKYEKSAKKCRESDAKLGREAAKRNEIVINHCGCGKLLDVAIPIIINNEYIATAFTGQFLFEEPNLDEYKKLAEEFGIEDVDDYLEAVKKIRVLSEEEVLKLANSFRLYVEMIFNSAYEKYKNRELAEYYSNLVYSLPIPTNVYSLDFKRIDVSNSTEKMFGYTLDELKDKSSFNKIYSEEDLRKMEEAFELAKQGQNASIEAVATRKDNTTFYMVVNFAPIKNKKGEIVNIIGTGTDISDIKNLQEYYQSVFYWLPLPATLNDLNGRRLEASIAVEKLYGYTIKELKGVKLEDIYDPKDKEDMRRAVNKTLTEGVITGIETQVIRKNGEKIPVLVNFSPVKNKNNEIINLIGTATDLTEIKNREKEYQKATEDMTRVIEYISSGNYDVAIDTNYKVDDLQIMTGALNEVLKYLYRSDTELRNLIKELATPAIEVSKGVIVMPLIGRITSDRAMDAMKTMLDKICATNAIVGILDITGVPSIDSAVADSILKAIKSIKILGAEPILCGISPDIAYNLVRLDITFDFVTKSNLSEALNYVNEKYKNI